MPEEERTVIHGPDGKIRDSKTTAPGNDPFPPATKGDRTMTFKMNPGAEKAIAEMAVKAVADRFQPILDGMHTEYAGQPVDTIKPVLARRWAAGNTGAGITDPDLTNVAQAISDGKRVVIVDGRLTAD